MMDNDNLKRVSIPELFEPSTFNFQLVIHNFHFLHKYLSKKTRLINEPA